jgi:hypothetical protein
LAEPVLYAPCCNVASTNCKGQPVSTSKLCEQQR